MIKAARRPFQITIGDDRRWDSFVTRWAAEDSDGTRHALQVETSAVDGKRFVMPACEYGQTRVDEGAKLVRGGATCLHCLAAQSPITADG